MHTGFDASRISLLAKQLYCLGRLRMYSDKKGDKGELPHDLAQQRKLSYPAEYTSNPCRQKYSRDSFAKKADTFRAEKC